MQLSETDGFLLDVDGTLIDSNRAHASAWSDAFGESGFNFSTAQILPYIGMGGDHLLPRLAGIDKESTLGEKVDRRRGEIFHEKYLPQLKAFPGARELLQHLKQLRKTLVIATSASAKDLRALLKQAGLDGCVENKTTASDAESSKPDPDIILAALKKSGLPSTRVLMIGDTPYDIEAATRAGVRTIAFTSGGWDREALRGALAIYEGPADYLSRIQ